jgi:phosphoribosylformylglycinamidine cyclo-ligase
MFKVLNCGTRLEIYLEEKYAAQVIDIAKSFAIDAQVIGHVESATANEVHLSSPYGEFTYQ